MNDETPLISVVTATYNALEGLKTTISSVAEQSLEAIEHVIVDGGSSDGTVEFLTQSGSGLNWISEADEGIADAMNKGIGLARGKYILVLHAEDYLVNSHSLKELEEVLQQGADIVSCHIYVKESDGSLRLVRTAGMGLRSHFHMTLPHQGALCRRDLFNRIGRFDPSYPIAMDYDFFLRSKADGASLQLCDQILSVMPSTGVSSRKDWAGLSARLNDFKRLHLAHSNSPIARFGYQVYWLIYPTFKRLKTAMFG